jgi:hypothetical protein
MSSQRFASISVTGFGWTVSLLFTQSPGSRRE